MQLRDTILDQYNIRARLYPTLLLLGPSIAIILLLVPNKDKELLWGMTLVIFPLVYLLTNIVRNIGKESEKKIFPNNELPSHLALKDVGYCKIIGLDINISDQLPWKELPPSARVRQFINHTRNTKEFPVVFDTLCNYGFYRNLYSIRFYLWIAFAIHCVMVIFAWMFEDIFKIEILTLIIFIILNLIIVLLISSQAGKKSVKRAAENYTCALFRAGLKIKPLPNSV